MKKSETTPNSFTTATAVFLMAAHGVASSIVFGYFYWVVPRLKTLFDDFGVVVSPPVQLLINQSDMVMNYWYFIIVCVLIAMAVDFSLLRWLSQRIGMIRTLLSGFCLTVLIILQVVFAHYFFSAELDRIRAVLSTALTSISHQV